MRRIDKLALAGGVLLGLVFCVVAWAITIDQIWANVYDSTNSSLRITQVSP